MATGKLSTLAAAGMQAYVAGLSPPKEENYNFQAGYNAVFNQMEDFWDKVVEIDDDYTIPENAGSMTIIIKSALVISVDPVIELPLISTNIGRRLLFINENATYRPVIVPKSGSGDNIEEQSQIDMEKKEYQHKIELIGTSNGWRRIAREFSLVPESVRPAGWILNNGQSGSWTDVSFNTWVQDGVYALLLQYVVLHIGNSAYDYTVFNLRPKGSTIDNYFKNTFVQAWFTNLTTGFTLGMGQQIIVKCDWNGVIQYKQLISSESGGGSLFLTIAGFWR